MKKKNIMIGAITAISAAATYMTAGRIAIEEVCKRPKKQKKGLKHPMKESDKEWLERQKFIDMEITSFDGLKLEGQYLPYPHSDKVVICVHGFRSNHYREFAYYIRFYHELGYNILLPDNRAHGHSEGSYIGFGWLDRLDLLEWIKKIEKYFQHDPITIVLHGISMGGATVLMTSGEELSENVKAIIADCSYTSAYDEFKYYLRNKHVPSFLLLPSATLLSKKVVGYNFKEASALEQVKKSKTPTLFIHGNQDHFVPTHMALELYNACQAEKKLLIVNDAAHAESYHKEKELVENNIKTFLEKYVNGE